MGTIRKGANGGFSGKAGSVVGSSWRDIEYIRGLPKLSGKAATEKQLEQRARFLVAVNFLQPIKRLLELGFKTQKTGKATGYNIGLQLALKEAVVGTYPDIDIDYTKVSVSRGGHGQPVGMILTATEPGKVTISWSPLVNAFNAFADDQAVILLYNSAKKLFLSNETPATRGEGKTTMAIPPDFIGDTIDAWMFFTTRDKVYVSSSAHAGPVVIL